MQTDQGDPGSAGDAGEIIEAITAKVKDHITEKQTNKAIKGV